MVTALLKYLDLLVIFLWEHVDLILYMTILLDYLHPCNEQQAKLQFSDSHFFLNFVLCLGSHFPIFVLFL